MPATKLAVPLAYTRKPLPAACRSPSRPKRTPPPSYRTRLYMSSVGACWLTTAELKSWTSEAKRAPTITFRHERESAMSAAL